MAKDQGALAAFMTHLEDGGPADLSLDGDSGGNANMASSPAGLAVSTVPDQIEKASQDYKDYPKEHIVAYRTKTGKFRWFVKPKFAHLYGKSEGRRGRIGGGAAPGKRIAPEIKGGPNIGGIIPEKRVGISIVPRRKKIVLGGRRKRELPPMQVHPVTGQRYGPGVARVPSAVSGKLKYTGAQMISGALTGGVASAGQTASDILGRKTKDWVYYQSLSPEMKRRFLASRAKTKARRLVQEKQYRAAGLWEPERETTTSRIIRGAIWGGTIRAFQNAATSVNHLLSRKPGLSSIEVSINPLKAKQTMDYFYSRSRKNTFRTLAEAQMNQDRILAGVERGDPDYTNPNAMDALNYWEGIVRNIRKYGDKKLGPGWLEEASERNRRILPRLKALAEEVYSEARTDAISLGVEDPDRYALARTRRVLGTDPHSTKLYAEIYNTYSNVDAPNLTTKLDDRRENIREFKEATETARRKIKSASPKVSRQARVPVEQKGEPTLSGRRVSESKLKRYETAIQAEKGRKTLEGEKEKLEYGKHLMAMPPEKLITMIYSMKGRDYARSIYRGDTGVASSRLNRDFSFSPAKAKQIVVTWKRQVEARKQKATKAQLTQDLRKLGNLRDCVGVVQSEGLIINKTITSSPVGGLLLVREDLAGRRRRKVARKRRRRRIA